MIVEDYVENGATQVKSPPISRSSPSGPQPCCLMKSIISFLNQIAVSVAIPKDHKGSRLLSLRANKIKEWWIIPFGGGESDRQLLGMCLMKCRRSQCSLTHWGCQDIEPERPWKPPMAASKTGCTDQPWAILHVWLCIYLCPRVLLHARLIRMFMHLCSLAHMFHSVFWRGENVVFICNDICLLLYLCTRRKDFSPAVTNQHC